MTSRKATARATAKTRQSLRCFLGREADFSAARLTMGSWAAPVEMQALGGEIESGLREGAAMECTHLNQIRKVKPSANGCEECLKIGSTWVHLRMCLECGHVGCCDSSPNKHATKHFHKTKHPIMRSIEPGESWGWCYIDEVELDFS
jgi:uncharacterized UBP type Zn finger protein